jgi:hypothetical protein
MCKDIQRFTCESSRLTTIIFIIPKVLAKKTFGEVSRALTPEKWHQ